MATTYRIRWIEDDSKDCFIYRKEHTYNEMVNILGRMNKLMPYLNSMDFGVKKDNDEFWCEVKCVTEPEIAGKNDEKQYTIEHYHNGKDREGPQVFARVDQNGHLFMKYQEPYDDMCLYIDSDAIYTLSKNSADAGNPLCHYVKTYYQINLDPHEISELTIKLNPWPVCDRRYEIKIRRKDDSNLWIVKVKVTRKYYHDEVNCYDEEELDESEPTAEELKAILEAPELNEYKPLGGR